MTDNLADVHAEIRELKRRIKVLESASPLGYSSISEGALEIRSEEGLIVDGSARIDGILTGSGAFNWSGDMNLEGTQTVTGPTEFIGEMTVTGPWSLDGNGSITGNVDVEGNLILDGAGKVYVGTGASQIVIDGATGTITVPGTHPIRLHKDSVSGLGRIDLGTTGRIWSGGDGVTIAHNDGTAAAINVYSDGIDLAGTIHLGPLDGLPSGVTGRYLIKGSDGIIYEGSVGGGGGDPGDPPAGNPDGYIWPADPAVYGISDDFADHVARGSAEPGVDIRTPVGTPIWSPADGTIVAVKTTTSGATGRYITLVTDAGDWFRFLHADSVVVTENQTVTQTQLLGYSGGSGFDSEAYYGPHIHLSFATGYTGLFPGASALDDFEAYMASV